MWIFDSYYKGSMQLWDRERGLTRACVGYPPSFYMHLPDPPAHRDMIEALESRFKTEECSFKTISEPWTATGSTPGARSQRNLSPPRRSR